VKPSGIGALSGVMPGPSGFGLSSSPFPLPPHPINNAQQRMAFIDADYSQKPQKAIR